MEAFNKEKSIQLKGIAILFMFWIHLYYHDNRLKDGIYYLSMLTGKDVRPIKFVLNFCKVCVPLYLFVAGYAFGTKIIQKEEISFWRIVKKNYTKYWIVFFLFIPVCAFLGEIQITPISFVLNLIGLLCTYCREWWFLSLYIELEGISCILDRLGCWNRNAKQIVVISLGLMLLGYGMKMCVPEFALHSMVGNHIYLLLIKQPIYLSGLLCVKNNVFDRVANKIGDKWPLFLVGWLFELTNLPESFFLPIVIPGLVYSFTQINLVKNVERVLLLLGKFSAYMWLTHSILIYYLAQPLVYLFHYSIMNLLVIILLDIPISVLLTYFEKCAIMLIRKIGRHYENLQ